MTRTATTTGDEDFGRSDQGGTPVNTAGTCVPPARHSLPQHPLQLLQPGLQLLFALPKVIAGAKVFAVAFSSSPRC
jgi:hypothetical protein